MKMNPISIALFNALPDIFKREVELGIHDV